LVTVGGVKLRDDGLPGGMTGALPLRQAGMDVVDSLLQLFPHGKMGAK